MPRTCPRSSSSSCEPGWRQCKVVDPLACCCPCVHLWQLVCVLPHRHLLRCHPLAQPACLVGEDRHRTRHAYPAFAARSACRLQGVRRGVGSSGSSLPRHKEARAMVCTLQCGVRTPSRQRGTCGTASTCCCASGEQGVRGMPHEGLRSWMCASLCLLPPCCSLLCTCAQHAPSTR